MQKVTKLPLEETIETDEAEDTCVLYIQIQDTNGDFLPLTGATLTGEIKEELGRLGASLGSLTFDNDLDIGIIKAFVPLALANTLVDDFGADARLFTDVKMVFDGWNSHLKKATLVLGEVVTP